MTELQEIQVKIAAAVKNKQWEAALPFICSHGSLPHRQGLEVYQNSIEAALIYSLRDTYEVCHALVGDDFFTAMAAQYVQVTPSSSPNINVYGESFSEFIANFPPANSVVYLADVARLEWAWLKAFNGKNNVTLPMSHFEKLLNLDIEKIIFTLPADATLLSSDYPIHKIWNMHHHQKQDAISLDEGGVQLLIWRQDFQMRMDLLNPLQWAFLNYLQMHLTLPSIYQKMQTHLDETAFFIFLQDAVKQGWLGGILHD
jgi:hypothetical protein